eukprot:48794-Prymnesium_polylepis.1
MPSSRSMQLGPRSSRSRSATASTCRATARAGPRRSRASRPFTRTRRATSGCKISSSGGPSAFTCQVRPPTFRTYPSNSNSPYPFPCATRLSHPSLTCAVASAADDIDWHARELYLETGVPPDENSVAAIELTNVSVTLAASEQ